MLNLRSFLFLILFCFLSAPCFASAIELRQQGLAYRSQQRWSEAIDALERSVALAPQDISGYIILGWTQHLARHPGASGTLWQALKLNAWATEAANALGIVYLVKGELRQAILVHTWAALVKPQNEIAHYNLCLAYQRSGLPDWALSHGERAISLEPDNPHPRLAVAIVYWGMGERTKATAFYRDAIAFGAYQTIADLDYLAEAGFSPEQIMLTKEIHRQVFP